MSIKSSGQGSAFRIFRQINIFHFIDGRKKDFLGVIPSLKHRGGFVIDIVFATLDRHYKNPLCWFRMSSTQRTAEG